MTLIGVSQCVHEVLDVAKEKLNEFNSPGFPTSCCSPASFTIQMAPMDTPGYIRMTFSDLDLPIGSKLEVLYVTALKYPIYMLNNNYSRQRVTHKFL